MFTLNAEFINDVLPAKGDKSRHYINGVIIRDIKNKNETIREYIATNGHILLLERETLPEGYTTLPEEILLRINKKITDARKIEDIFLFLKDNEMAHLYNEKNDLEVEFSNVTPPNLDKIIGEYSDYEVNDKWTPFAPRYLVMICDFFKRGALWTPRKHISCFNSGQAAHRWDYENKTAILMPVRLEM